MYKFQKKRGTETFPTDRLITYFLVLTRVSSSKYFSKSQRVYKYFYHELYSLWKIILNHFRDRDRLDVYQVLIGSIAEHLPNLDKNKARIRTVALQRNVHFELEASHRNQKISGRSRIFQII